MMRGERTIRSRWMVGGLSILLLIGCRSGTKESTAGGSTAGDTATITTMSTDEAPQRKEMVTWSI